MATSRFIQKVETVVSRNLKTDFLVTRKVCTPLCFFYRIQILARPHSARSLADPNNRLQGTRGVSLFVQYGRGACQTPEQLLSRSVSACQYLNSRRIRSECLACCCLQISDIDLLLSNVYFINRFVATIDITTVDVVWLIIILMYPLPTKSNLICHEIRICVLIFSQKLCYRMGVWTSFGHS